jgi:hypothetical protein
MEEFHGMPIQNVYRIWSLHILYSYEAFPVWSGKQHNSWLPFLKFLRPCAGLVTRVAAVAEHWLKNLHDTFLYLFCFSITFLSVCFTGTGYLPFCTDCFYLRFPTFRLCKKVFYVSEWGNFLFDFLGHNDKVHTYKSLTMMHILIKASILVGFAPSAHLCLPLTHTNLSVP